MFLKQNVNIENETNNLLKCTYVLLNELPKTFRDDLRNECGWSEATFYRKAKMKKQLTPAEKDKFLQVLAACGERIETMRQAVDGKSVQHSELI